MTKKRKSEFPYLKIIAGLLGAVLFLLALIIFKPVIQRRLTQLLNIEITFRREAPESVPAPIGPARPPSGEAAPAGSTTQSLQGSFTELFSGVGWRNPLNSTVHQDFKTLTISFPPAYEWEEVSTNEFFAPVEKPQEQIDLSEDFYSFSVHEINSRIFVGGVKKAGERYEGYLYEFATGELKPIGPAGPIFSSEYAGKIVFGSDSSSKMFLLYAAYEGKAYEISVGSSVSIKKDYSSIFNARVTEEGGLNPKVVFKDGSWWISSVLASAEASASKPKLLRIRGGLGTDFTPLLLEDAAQFEFFSASGENAFYGVLTGRSGERRVFRLRDLGFKRSGKLIWESLRLNVWDGDVLRGRFTRIDAGEDGGSIKYYLSSNGGRDWVEAELGKFVDFREEGGLPAEASAKAGDFRWRAEFFPSNNQFTSPWVKQIGVEYYIIRE